MAVLENRASESTVSFEMVKGQIEERRFNESSSKNSGIWPIGSALKCTI